MPQPIASSDTVFFLANHAINLLFCCFCCKKSSSSPEKLLILDLLYVQKQSDRLKKTKLASPFSGSSVFYCAI